MLKNFFRNAAIAISVALPAVTIAESASAAQSLTVWNNTDLVVTDLFVTSSRSGRWGYDRLGSMEIESGDTYNLTFTNGSNHCYYDITVVYEDNSYDQIMGADLCIQEFYEFFGAGGDFYPWF